MVKSHITKFIKTQGEHILERNNSRDAWKFIKNITNTATTKLVPPVSTEELNNFFARAVDTDSSNEPLCLPSGCDPEDVFELKEISSHSVQYKLTKLKEITATGQDGLPSAFLKKRLRLSHRT